ncbi:pogo transposable element with ZNF domain isoform 2-T2 [Odontesthes bonariensis]|uniref:pogo transposable element with ZNF domain isoform X2 n=1 Tax=Odontesthes bonariensis TaxID=219752 RepID=UPI003F58D7BA
MSNLSAPEEEPRTRPSFVVSSSGSNMDTELFMECEEEELEPWQQVDDSVEEDEMDFTDAYGEPVEDSLSPLPASETPPPRTPPPRTPPRVVFSSSASSPVCIVSSSVRPPPPSSITTTSTLCLPACSAPPLMAQAPPLMAQAPPLMAQAPPLMAQAPPLMAQAPPLMAQAPPLMAQAPPLMAQAPPLMAQAPPLMAQAPPLFLTQTASGTFLLPAAPGSGGSQPFLLTTQGFQMPAGMNPGTPLLLNLQPGQTVRPLTLIQSPSLGQLVRPSVGVSPVLPQGPAPSGGPVQPGSAFTAMQLPATLTIRTTTAGPVNLQVTQMGGANSLKLAGSPALPSGSANGVTRTVPLSSGLTALRPAPSVVMTPGVTVAPASDAPRVVMSVEEFYYGTFEGDLSLRKPQPLGIKTSTFTCQICSHLAENNLRLMQHMLQHSELIAGGSEQHCCRFCYRQFSSPTQLQSHQDQVHGSAPSSCMCRICEWAFENEPTFLNHMKSNHKPGEMPYICQVCSYRSSFYSDVLQHFASFHRDSRFLLCVFCLKVTRNPVNYQQHLLRHQVNQAFHCNRCRLQFVFLKDKMQHKLENHRSFRRPARLEGLPPGSKVTVRTYGKIKPLMTSAGSRLFQSPTSLVQPIRIKTEPQKSAIQKSPPGPRSKSPTKRGAGRREHASRMPYGDRLVCLECGTDASDFSAHYPTHVHCLLCPYSSCCSRAYAAHMIQHHLPRSRDKLLPLHRLPPPCAFRLRCSRCDFLPPSADRMAEHLLTNPGHRSATCRSQSYVEPDIQFCFSEGQQPPNDREPGQNQGSSDLSWKSADCWKPPPESSNASAPIAPFTQPSGPHYSPSKNSDAIDFFNLLFPAAVVELITKETNAHAKTCHFLDSCPPDWVPVTAHEVKGFIGLVILMGVHNLPDMSHYWSWNHFDNSYTFYRAMSFKRFKQIAASIRMGSLVTNEYRGSTDSSDSLHIFRPMLDILGGAMWSAYRPNCCLTVDRALLPSLEQEGPHSKGNPKTQPQVWLLCDSKSGYCHRFFIQLGVTAGQDPGFTVVPELVKGLEGKHHQLYLANSLTSVPLMQSLLDQGIYASSSFPPASPILPRSLWEEGRLEKPGDFLQRQFGPLLATRWKDTKEMGCLSTNAAPAEPDTVWRRSQTTVGSLDPITRPMAFRLLQENMRGVDICKQLLACNPLGGLSQDLHWRNVFWFLVNLSVVNAFIVLRESRKENPPAWVQDGLFTQVNFRKRLGNQLAKCAQKYFETMEMAGSRGTRGESSEEPVKQRHRMGKISNISKRCKNCNLKNVRHESVYGCIVCKANLCKQPSCFWEYHGLSAHNKGSAKVGFLKDRLSGAVEVIDVTDSIDETMGPIEDLDFSDDEKLDDLEDVEKTEIDKEEFIAEVKHSGSGLPSATNGLVQPAAMLSGSKEREDSLSARQLRIAMFALCDGLRQASRVFSTETQLIRSWLQEARKRLKHSEQEQRAQAVGSERMVAWVLSMREQQLPITESNLFHKASTLKKKGAFSNSFRISYDWAVSFLLRHRLGVRSVGRAASLGRVLPPCLEAKVKSFREFTQKVFRTHSLTETSVAAVDELCLFVDLSSAQDKSRSSEALELTGSLPLVTVYLSLLADGTMLPSLVLAARQLPLKVLPEFVLLQTNPEGLSVDETLELWTSRVWLKHLSGAAQPRKSMLILDRNREHLGDQFLASISGSHSLPAVIPGGCSFCLQPLEVCLKPVLQRFLLSRWSKFAAGNPPELEETVPHQLQTKVTQVLVDWVVEALTTLNNLTHMWKQSFDLQGILPASEGESEKVEDEPGQKPEDIQSDLLKSLTEILLGAEATTLDSSELLELEDEDEPEEVQQGGEEQETPDEKQEDTKDEGMEAEEAGQETEEMDEGGREADGTPEDDETEEQDGKEVGMENKEKADATPEGDKTEEQDRKENKEKADATQEGDKTEEQDRKENKEKADGTPEGDKTEEQDRKENKEKADGKPEDDEEEERDRKEVGKENKEKADGKPEDDETEERDGKENKEKADALEDSEEEGKETEEDRKEASKERRETRIVIGEEVGDEWKLTVKSRVEGVENNEEEDNRMEES